MHHETFMQKNLSPQRELALLLTLAGIQFTHIVDFMVMMPLGPQLREIFKIQDAQFGLLVSAYTLAAGASSLLASLYIDRIGRKRLLLVMYVLLSVATLACALVGSYAYLLLARIAAGFFGGVLSALVQTIVGESVPYERRGKAMGIVMAAFSLSTVAGVPLALLLAQWQSWQTPFFAIAAAGILLALFAWWTLPAMPIAAPKGVQQAWQNWKKLLQDAHNQRAFAFSGLSMMVGFITIPFITMYLQSNVGLSQDQMPLMYLCGGVATMLSSRLVGGWSDKYGKQKIYRVFALLAILPLFALTNLPQGTPLPLVLLVTTSFFVIVSSRMIPSMALLTASVVPQMRGSFMSLNSAIQSAAMGLGAWLGGHIIARNAAQQIQHYWLCALLGSVASLAAVYLVGSLRVLESPPGTNP